MSDKDIEALRERVGNGIEWLVANDPKGAFNLWFTAGLTSLSPMPAQDPATVEAWKAYFKQRQRWEKLSADLGRVDPTWG